MSTSPFDVNKPTTPTTWLDEICAVCVYGPAVAVFVLVGSVWFAIRGRR